MKNYKIIFISDNNRYKSVVFSINHISPLDDIYKIEQDLISKGIKGYILFDLLLSNGNEFNRYVEAYFDGESFNLLEFKKPIITSFVKEVSNDFFKKNIKLLENGILSSIDIFDIKYSFNKIQPMQ